LEIIIEKDNYGTVNNSMGTTATGYQVLMMVDGDGLVTMTEEC
jgi:hypothetical protein